MKHRGRLFRLDPRKLQSLRVDLCEVGNELTGFRVEQDRRRRGGQRLIDVRRHRRTPLGRTGQDTSESACPRRSRRCSPRASSRCSEGTLRRTRRAARSPCCCPRSCRRSMETGSRRTREPVGRSRAVGTRLQPLRHLRRPSRRCRAFAGAGFAAGRDQERRYENKPSAIHKSSGAEASG